MRLSNTFFLCIFKIFISWEQNYNHFYNLKIATKLFSFLQDKKGFTYKKIDIWNEVHEKIWTNRWLTEKELQMTFKYMKICSFSKKHELKLFQEVFFTYLTKSPAQLYSMNQSLIIHWLWFIDLLVFSYISRALPKWLFHCYFFF